MDNNVKFHLHQDYSFFMYLLLVLSIVQTKKTVFFALLRAFHIHSHNKITYKPRHAHIPSISHGYILQFRAVCVLCTSFGCLSLPFHLTSIVISLTRSTSLPFLQFSQFSLTFIHSLSLATEFPILNALLYRLSFLFLFVVCLVGKHLSAPCTTNV